MFEIITSERENPTDYSPVRATYGATKTEQTWNDVNQYATNRFHFWSDGKYVRQAAAMMQTMLPVAIVITRAAHRLSVLNPHSWGVYLQFLICVATKLAKLMSRGRGRETERTPQQAD